MSRDDRAARHPAPEGADIRWSPSTRSPQRDYRIHPLLTEAVRRRLVAGGVDVAQAQGTILRAVRLDLARGDIDRAFRRLVAANEPEEAARVLAEHGVTMLMRGQGDALRLFARHARGPR